MEAATPEVSRLCEKSGCTFTGKCLRFSGKALPLSDPRNSRNLCPARPGRNTAEAGVRPSPCGKRRTPL